MAAGERQIINLTVERQHRCAGINAGRGSDMDAGGERVVSEGCVSAVSGFVPL